MENSVSLLEINISLAKDFLSDEQKVAKVVQDIENLKSIPLDLSKTEDVDKIEAFKKRANKFVKELKECCEPLEAEGKRISDARSKITSSLVTGKNSVVEHFFKPIYEVEALLKDCKMWAPISNIQEGEMRLKQIAELRTKKFFSSKIEADTLFYNTENSINSKIEEFKKLHKEAEEKELQEQKAREDRIRAEVEERVQKQAEEQIKQAEIAREKAELEKKQAEERVQKQKEQEDEKRKNDIENQRKINNEILDRLVYCGLAVADAKTVISEVAGGTVPHMHIIY